MTIKPATYNLRIPQRATLRQPMKLPFSCVGKTVVAQIWDQARTEKLLDLAVEWTDRAAGEFNLYATRQQTELVERSGVWDLLVIDDATDDADYWLEGTANLDRGYSEDEF